MPSMSGGYIQCMVVRKRWSFYPPSYRVPEHVSTPWPPNPKPFGHFARCLADQEADKQPRPLWMIYRKRCALGWSPKGTWRRDAR